MCSKQYLLFDTLTACKDLYRVSLIPNGKGTREDKRNSNWKEKKIDAAMITVLVHFSMSLCHNTAPSK